MLTLLLLLLSPNAPAADLSCEAWYQADGQEKVVVPMSARFTETTSAVFSASIEGFSYYANADFVRGVMYIDIERGMPQTNVLFVTGLMPTAEVFQLTDLHLPLGPRLSVKCSV
ncbi:MAG: hypothetical protein ACXVCK_21000, partial [Bdellovibrionota bacterium]